MTIQTKTRTYFIFLILFFVSSSAFSQDQVPPTQDLLPTTPQNEKPKDGPVIVKQPQNVIIEGSSEHIRMNKRWEINPFILGLGSNYISDHYGVRIGKLLDYKNVLAMEFGMHYSFSNSYSIEVQYKHFFGNSFFLASGLQYSLTKYNSSQYSFTNFQFFNGRFTGVRYGLNVEIGNQWGFENGVTIGCVWFGLNPALSKSISEESYSGNYTQNDLASYRTDSQNNLGAMLFTSLKFYVGYTF